MSGTITNANIVDFGTAGAGDWGTIVGATLHDAAAAGNQIAQSTLTGGSKVVNNGDPVSFAAGALSFVLSSEISDYAAIALLNSLFGKTSNFGALASAPTIYVRLWTVLPNSAGTGGTECVGTGYAAEATVAGDWNVAS